MSCKGLSLMSGGLDSQLAVRVLQGAGAEVEGVCFETPFFSSANARKAAAALGVKIHVLDFTEDEVEYDAAIAEGLACVLGTHGQAEPGVLHPLEAAVFSM